METIQTDSIQNMVIGIGSGFGRKRSVRRIKRSTKKSEIVTDSQKSSGRFFQLFALNAALLSAAILITALTIGAVGKLHETKTTRKEKASAVVQMMLPEEEIPPPPERIEPPVTAEPEMILTLKSHQALKAEKKPPEIRIDIPRIDLNANPLTGLDIGIANWHMPPMKSEYGMGEVDQVPMAVFQLPPDYPYHAKRQGTEGVVSIRFLVTREGAVSSFSVLKASPEGIFDEAARRSVLRWKFRPGLMKGETVNTWVEMDIEFELG